RRAGRRHAGEAGRHRAHRRRRAARDAAQAHLVARDARSDPAAVGILGDGGLAERAEDAWLRMSEKKRLFLAVNLGVGTTRKIADAIVKMRAAADRRGLRVGWVPPANLHVTLKFLGWSSPDVIHAVRDRVVVAMGGMKGFELQARGAGGFP